MTSLMVSMMAFIAGVKDRFSSEKGATATEYSLLVGLIALVLVVGVGFFGTTPQHLVQHPRHHRQRLVTRISKR